MTMNVIIIREMRFVVDQNVVRIDASKLVFIIGAVNNLNM